VDRNKLRISTTGGTPLITQPAEDFFHIMALFKKGGAHLAVRCSLEGIEGSLPPLAIDLPRIHTNDHFFKPDPVILPFRDGRHFTIGFK